jgi:phosphatidylglycerophosphate synthase
MTKGIVIAAASEGKVKTFIQMLTVMVILGVIVIREKGMELGDSLTRWVPVVLVSITMVATLLSGAIYLLRHKELILPSHE